MRTLKEIYNGMDEQEFTVACANYKFFAENVLGYKIQPFHLEWIKMLQSNRRVAIEAPTGFGKTTILGDAFCLWTAWIEKDKEMCIISKSLPQSTKLLNKIKDIIENNEFLDE